MLGFNFHSEDHLSQIFTYSLLYYTILFFLLFFMKHSVIELGYLLLAEMPLTINITLQHRKNSSLIRGNHPA